MRTAPFFFLVQLFATADALDFLASDEVHYPAGTEPDATKAAEEAGGFFASDDHGLDEDQITEGVVKVWGPFYLDAPLEVRLTESDTSDTGWEAVA